MALSLGFGNGGVDEEPDSDMVAAVEGRWGNQLDDLETAD
jgi:hypothetical protein